MTTYYVFKPGFSLTAEVDASNTKHARTAFLDYLSRNELVSWNDRQKLRKELKAVRMDPGEAQTSVQLEYGVGEPPSRELPSSEEPQENYPELEDYPEDYPEQVDTPQGVAPSAGKLIIGGSPIEKLSRETKGLLGPAKRPSWMGED